MKNSKCKILKHLLHTAVSECVCHTRSVIDPWIMLEKALPCNVTNRIDQLCTSEQFMRTDSFGMNIASARRTVIAASLIYKYYFRCNTTGIENIPTTRTILVANHAGQLPFDALMITTSIALESKTPTICRSMMDRRVPGIPFVSSWYAQTGVVLGTRENARYLLEHEETILTFPEGVSGIQKPLSHAYHLQEFGLGFARLALQFNAPVIPVAVVGSEEQYPTLYSINRPNVPQGFPSIPLWFHLPIPLLGLLPLPVKYHIHFGRPILLDGDPDADDDIIASQANRVKTAIERQIEHLRDNRKGIFL